MFGADPDAFLDQLLLMLRGFRSMSVLFVRPACPSPLPRAVTPPAMRGSMTPRSRSARPTDLVWRRLEFATSARSTATFINAVELTAETSLCNGDVVGLGDFRLVFIDARTLRSPKCPEVASECASRLAQSSRRTAPSPFL